jgi:hypothetical protein
VAEQELLAIVYALEKFRIYVYGHRITLYTDNKALTFLNKCTLTSSRIARWVMEIQEYCLDIKHISGMKNLFADALSRNPAGLSEAEVKDLSRPRGIVIVKIDLQIDSYVRRKLKNVSTYQKQDAKLSELLDSTKLCPGQTDGRYLVRNETLYCKDDKNHQYWRTVMPTALETDLVKYVHSSIGHLGSEKCMAHILYQKFRAEGAKGHCTM